MFASGEVHLRKIARLSHRATWSSERPLMSGAAIFTMRVEQASSSGA